MNKRFAVRWASSVLSLFISAAGAKDAAQNVIITGIVKTESGVLVKGATIIVFEYVARLARMPDVKIRSVQISDRDAAFSVKLDNVRGDLDLMLVGDHCEWKDETVRVTLASLKGANKHEVNIVPRDDRC